MAMHALGRLIAYVMATQNWNQAEVARRAGLSRSRVSQIINEPIRSTPDRETVINLARGLGVPPWVVMDAVLEALALPTRPTHIDIEQAVAADLSLDAASKRAVLAFVEHMRSELPKPDMARVQGIRLAEDDPVVRDRADTPNRK